MKKKRKSTLVTSMNTIIQTKDLSKSFGKTLVLKSIDLTIEQGEFTAIMKPSGSVV